jgi:hypothetical protein
VKKSRLLVMLDSSRPKLAASFKLKPYLLAAVSTKTYLTLSDPLANPLVDPPADPLEDPLVDPLANRLANPLADPLVDPLADRLANPLADPLVDPLADRLLYLPLNLQSSRARFLLSCPRL